MTHLIDKDTVVTEIENLENTYKKCPTRNSYEEGLKNGRLIGYKDALHKINTLETKEVDLEKELENLLEKEKTFVTDNREVKYYNGDSFNHIYELEFIAKYFYELGLKTKDK